MVVPAVARRSLVAENGEYVPIVVGVRYKQAPPRIGRVSGLDLGIGPADLAAMCCVGGLCNTPAHVWRDCLMAELSEIDQGFANPIPQGGLLGGQPFGGRSKAVREMVSHSPFIVALRCDSGARRVLADRTTSYWLQLRRWTVLLRAVGAFEQAAVGLFGGASVLDHRAHFFADRQIDAMLSTECGNDGCRAHALCDLPQALDHFG